MEFWIVLGVILALVILILLCPIHVLLLYDGKFTLKAGVWFLRFRIYPDRAEDLESDKLSDRKKRRILKKIIKKKERDERRAAKEREKQGTHKRKKASPKKLGDSLKKRHGKGLVRDLGMILRVVRILARKFGKKLHIRIRQLTIVAATDDAAKTAYVFGVLSQMLAYFLAAADSYTNVTFRNRRVGVRADFLSEKTRVKAEILFRIRVVSVIGLAFSAFWQFAKESLVENTNTPSAPDSKTEDNAYQNNQNEKGITA